MTQLQQHALEVIQSVELINNIVMYHFALRYINKWMIYPRKYVKTYLVIFRHDYEWNTYSSENNRQKYEDNIVQLISYKSPFGFNNVNNVFQYIWRDSQFQPIVFPTFSGTGVRSFRHIIWLFLINAEEQFPACQKFKHTKFSSTW